MVKCRQCGLMVIWQKVSGRITCTNPDGSDHWDRCSAERWKQATAGGKRFTETRGNEKVVGFLYRGKERLERISSMSSVRGAQYQPLTCNCECLPWEINPNCAQQMAWIFKHATP